MTKRELTCIGCPMGCHISISFDPENMNPESMEITGNTCKVGYNYAISEVTNPTRVVTGTVSVANRTDTVASVKSKGPVPKDCIFDVAKFLKNVSVEAPLGIGDRISVDDENLKSKGVELVVTRAVK